MDNQNKPTIRLSGTNGNVFAVIGNIVNGLKRAGCKEQAKDFEVKSMECDSYDDVLVLAHKYAHIV